MIGAVVSDLIEETRRRIEAAAPASIDDVRNAGKPLVSMSDAVYEQHAALKTFLHKHLYSHEQKLEMTRIAKAIVKDLFAAYMADERLMPDEFAERGCQRGRSGASPRRRRLYRWNDRSICDRSTREHDRLIESGTAGRPP